jgi:signal transduction histidine kinase
VIDINKLDSGEVTLNFSKFDLKSLLDQVISSIKPLYTKKGLSFKIEGLESTEPIYADPVKLKQIFYNLLSNAIKFTFDGGITLQVFYNKSHWEFHVKDTGMGIAKNDIKDLFQPFKRVDNPIISRIKGTGLGLSITKKLVELHGGNIKVESKLGEGSSFKFQIPIIN